MNRPVPSLVLDTIANGTSPAQSSTSLPAHTGDFSKLARHSQSLMAVIAQSQGFQLLGDFALPDVLEMTRWASFDQWYRRQVFCRVWASHHPQDPLIQRLLEAIQWLRLRGDRPEQGQRSPHHRLTANGLVVGITNLCPPQESQGGILVGALL